MWRDVVDFNRFYRSRLGQTARSIVQAEIRHHWPDVSTQTVAGLGYATPYLDQFKGEASRLIAVMPAHQGVTHWPRGAPNQVALADETALPFEDLSIDRLLMVHAVENSEHLRALMREAWRVLSGQGRLLAVVPARRGLWSRSEKTPFGFGKPYSHTQMARLLKDSMFEPVSVTRALYMPPSNRDLILHSAGAWERLGKRWYPRFGGTLFVEARKQVYAASPNRETSFGTSLMGVPQIRPAMAGRMERHHPVENAPGSPFKIRSGSSPRRVSTRLFR